MTETHPAPSAMHLDRTARVVPWVLLVLSILTALAGLMRMFGAVEAVDTRFGLTTLWYFAVAGGLLLLREVKSLAFGDYKIEFRQLAQDARRATREATAAANAAEDAVIHGTLPRQAAVEPVAAQPEVDVRPGPDEGDPWKGALSGRSVDPDRKRRLWAEVTEIAHRRDWFTVRLVVESTAPRTHPLTDDVRFLLHPTFANDRPSVRVGADGRAELNLVAWGAFTVGAIADRGATRLELDLAQLEGAPAVFRES